MQSKTYSICCYIAACQIGKLVKVPNFILGPPMGSQFVVSRPWQHGLRSICPATWNSVYITIKHASEYQLSMKFNCVGDGDIQVLTSID